MFRIWAVARQMIRESIRMKVALIFILVLAVILPVLSYTVTGDGATLKSRIQMFLSFSLSAVGFLLSMLTIFLSCGALNTEIREKHIFMVASKPIPRWQFVVGKWLGIVLVDAFLLIGSGAIIWGFTRYLAHKPPANEDDAIAIEQEVLTSRRGVALKPPTAEIEAAVDARIRQLQSEGRMPLAMDRDQEQRRREEIRAQLKSEFLSVPPQSFKVYLFRDLHIDRSPGQYVTVAYRAADGDMPQNEIWPLIFVAGDPTERTTVVQVSRGDPAGRRHRVPIPASCISDDGILRLEVHNFDPKAKLSFGEPEGGLEVLHHIGGFGWNLVRGLILIALRLVFLSALGILFSAWLSFPVACMAVFLVFFAGVGGGFLMEAIDWTTPGQTAEDPMWVLGPPLRALAKAFLWVVPDLSKYNPVPTIVDGRAVTLMWLIQGTVQLALARGLLLGLLACWIFTRRELDQVIV